MKRFRPPQAGVAAGSNGTIGGGEAGLRGGRMLAKQAKRSICKLLLASILQNE